MRRRFPLDGAPRPRCKQKRRPKNQTVGGDATVPIPRPNIVMIFASTATPPLPLPFDFFAYSSRNISPVVKYGVQKNIADVAHY